ncbi:MAG: HAD-IA family hydrolase [Clostridia bacterium]|nr:HAD-IA family hydrolase [Clostridia bacterium]
MSKRLIIFDCFGVIFDEIAPIFFNKYLPEEKAAEVKEKIFVPADLGLIPYEQIFEEISKALDMDKNSIIEEWEGLIHLNEDMIPVIKKLGENADIALLSNAPLGFVERIFEENSLAPLFDKIVISCNIKMSKPDPEIYKYCVAQFNKNYDKIYMIDDNIKNLEHLPELGIIPIHFTDIESMLDKLN